MAKTFKVGDKVRIIDVDNILHGYKYFNNGDVTDVVSIDRDGDIRVNAPKRNLPFIIGKIEFNAIEKVDATPTKSQRISTLESEVEALKERVAELEKARSTKLSNITVNVKCGADVDKIAKELMEKHHPQTPNQRRKAVIDRAKAFVADVEKGAYKSYYHKLSLGEGSAVYRDKTTKPEYHVNKEKRVVTVLVKGSNFPKLYAKGISKCAPGDVFNEHIGKAIALAKAYGLEVPREFTHAPQPEIAEGQIVKAKPQRWYTQNPFKVKYIGGNDVYEADCAWIPKDITEILDDSEAQYDA